MDIIAQFFACFSQVPARKISTNWSARLARFCNSDLGEEYNFEGFCAPLRAQGLEIYNLKNIILYWIYHANRIKCVYVDITFLLTTF